MEGTRDKTGLRKRRRPRREQTGQTGRISITVPRRPALTTFCGVKKDRDAYYIDCSAFCNSSTRSIRRKTGYRGRFDCLLLTLSTKTSFKMNCPSRTDQDTIINPDWNQSPPFLPADLTTREDLNGRVNDRQFKDGSGVSSSSLDSLGGIDVVLERSIDPPIPRPCACADAKFPRYRDGV